MTCPRRCLLASNASLLHSHFAVFTDPKADQEVVNALLTHSADCSAAEEWVQLPCTICTKYLSQEDRSAHLCRRVRGLPGSHPRAPPRQCGPSGLLSQRCSHRPGLRRCQPADTACLSPQTPHLEPDTDAIGALLSSRQLCCGICCNESGRPVSSVSSTWPYMKCYDMLAFIYISHDEHYRMR